ncbi:MAG: hypothetical protein CMH57_11680 [Myxococcales bacterium]|nr:hypothetical protein [Myxococcales bacterium]
MKTCWRCSAELNSNSCDNCNALNVVGKVVLNGIIRDDDEVTVYTTEDGPGKLLVELHKNSNAISSLPRANKRNAIRSRAFKALWKEAIGDHPLLTQAEPQSFRVRKQSGAKYLLVEVHGLPAAPSHEPKPNGVPAEAVAEVADPGSIEEAAQAAAQANDATDAADAADAPAEATAEDAEAQATDAEGSEAPEATNDAPQDTGADAAAAPDDAEEATDDAAEAADAATTDAEASPASDEAAPAEEAAIAAEGDTSESDTSEADAAADADTGEDAAAGDDAPEADDAAAAAEAPADEGDAEADTAEDSEAPEATDEATDAAPEAGDAPEAAEPLAASADEAPAEDEAPAVDPRTLPLAALPEPGLSGAERMAALQAEMAALSGSGDPAAALAQLQASFEAPRAVRQLGENLMLCITYAQLALKADAQDKAREALERAFDLDPRDRVVLTEYGELLGQAGGDPELSMQVNRNLLLHHRNTLSAAELGTVYRRIGQGYQEQGDQDRARTCFERALDANAGDRKALDLLLETVEAQGDFEQVIAVRQRLLDQMRDPEGRAMLKVAIGDDYMDRLGDADKAIEAYEDALSDHVSVDALNKLARIAIDRQDWSRVANIYSQLGEVLTAQDEQATAWLQAGNTYRHRLGNHKAAADAFETCLDLDPSKLQAFKEITQIHAESEQWEALQGSYERMIARAEGLEEPDTKLIAVLNRNLGEVLRTHLGDRGGAIAAYERAASLVPEEAALTEILADLYAQADDSDDASLEAAIAYNRKLMASQPNNHELLARVANLHLRKQDFDQAYCIYRVLALLGKADDKALAFVQQHTPQTVAPLQQAITPEFYVQRLLGEGYDVVLAEVFDICREAITELLAHDLNHYGLKKKNRIDRQDDLMFVKLYRRVSEQLTYPEPPPVFRKDDLNGMINGSLYPPGFLVGARLLSGASEKEVTFTCAKQLSLFMNPSFLIQLRPMRDLQIIFYTVVKLFRPEVNIQFNAAMQRVAKQIQKLRPDRMERLKELMDQVLSRKTKIDVQLRQLQDTFEDAANRCGLLFCDDIAACGQALSAEPIPVNRERTTDDRMRALVTWTLTSDYHQIRKELGVAIG